MTFWYSSPPPGFLPTPSARRATGVAGRIVKMQFISTHALREEGDQNTDAGDVRVKNISTHALREEGDVSSVISGLGQIVISTHALREEGDFRHGFPDDSRE